MTVALVLLAAVTAARGVWSPCGLSMLSTITPLAERSRHHAYWRSACFFFLGSTLGGATLGLYMECISWLCRRSDLPSAARVVLTALVAVVCVAADARVGGLHLPEHPRQVDETWVQRFRPWAYAGGYGFQLGTAISTYVMTNAIYLVMVASILLLTPWQALGVGIAFGAFRGATILVGADVTSSARLLSVHRLLDRLATASLATTMAAQLGFLVVCMAALDSPYASIVGGVAVCSLAVASVVRVRTSARRSLVGAT